jgi:hypothetical protein
VPGLAGCALAPMLFESQALRHLTDSLRSRDTARFEYGWGWNDPRIPADGLRGVGIVDFAQRQTRTVGVPIPPRVLQQMHAVPLRTPLRRALFRVLRRRLARLSASEYRFDQRGSWIRDDPAGSWRSVSGLADPTWLIDLLDAQPDSVLASVKWSSPADAYLRLDLTDGRYPLPLAVASDLRRGDPRSKTHGVPLHISQSPPGMLQRIALSVGNSEYSREPVWQVVEFTESPAADSAPDLWREWYVRSGTVPA